MAVITNPRKQFNFRISFPGLPFHSYLAQDVTLPDSEIEEVSHGEGNKDIKTAGKRTFGKITVEKLLTSLPADPMNMAMWAWHDSCQSAISGGGNPPSAFKRLCVIEEMDHTGLIPINRWVCEGVWPSRIPGQKQSRGSSDNTIETVEFSVDSVSKSI